MRRLALSAAATILLLAPAAHAYIDPGTTNVAFSFFSYLAPLLGALGVAFAFVLRPVRRAFSRLLRLILGERAARARGAAEEDPPFPAGSGAHGEAGPGEGRPRDRGGSD